MNALARGDGVQLPIWFKDPQTPTGGCPPFLHPWAVVPMESPASSALCAGEERMKIEGQTLSACSARAVTDTRSVGTLSKKVARPLFLIGSLSRRAFKSTGGRFFKASMQAADVWSVGLSPCGSKQHEFAGRLQLAQNMKLKSLPWRWLPFEHAGLEASDNAGVHVGGSH